MLNDKASPVDSLIPNFRVIAPNERPYLKIIKTRTIHFFK